MLTISRAAAIASIVADMLATVGAVWVAMPLLAAAEPARSGADTASYVMEVALDPDARTITGTQTLAWTNPTEQATEELRYHLYYNAWRNEQSSFLRSVRYEDRDWEDWREHDWAYSNVEHAAIDAAHGWEETDLTGGLEFTAPDDDNAEDRTVLRVPLPRPVGPGESISVTMRWTAKVPRTFARTGVRGDYFFLAQWFPKVGVLEASGQWNCHQFIQTEFFADFGDYDVSMTVPTGWVVGATGREQDSSDNGDGTTTHRFVQTDVHDFAWTATPHFTEHTDRFEHDGLPSVDIRLLIMPDHAGQEARYFHATKVALEHYGSWWGPYPYGHITVIDPAYGSGSGGMEYPTLFTGGSRWLAPPERRQPESVTLHEAGHQFWYGVVANNEFEHAWLDEGFNSYTQARAMPLGFGHARLVRRYFEDFIPVVFDDIVLAERFDGADRYHGPQSDLKRDPVLRASWEHGPGSYGVNSYNRPAMTLRTLEHHLGWETFQRALSAYYKRWSFRHPKPEDFFEIVEEVSGQDLGWFWDQAFRRANVFDYAVGSVTSTPIGEGRGYDESLQLQKSAEDSDGSDFRSHVFVRRWGEGVFPVAVRVRFADGHEVMEQWDGKQRWARFDYVHPSRVERVDVDPDRVLVLDIHRANNGWMRQSQATIAATKWSSKWMFWVQNMMEAFAMFA